MKFNTIFLCFLLWSTVGILSVIASALRRYKANKEHELKTIYLNQFIFLAKRGKNTSDIIKELYYFFISNKRMRLILLKAMNLPAPKTMDYLYSKIGCEPMKIIHGFVLKRETQNREGNLKNIPEDIVKYFYELVEKWEEEYQQKLFLLKRRKLKALVEIITMLCINTYLYKWIQIDISLWIFVIVNTLGVILFIVLDNECLVVDKKNIRSFVGRKGLEKKTQFPARGLQSLYQLASGMGLIINIFIIVAGWLGPIT